MTNKEALDKLDDLEEALDLARKALKNMIREENMYGWVRDKDKREAIRKALNEQLKKGERIQ